MFCQLWIIFCSAHFLIICFSVLISFVLFVSNSFLVIVPLGRNHYSLASMLWQTELSHSHEKIRVMALHAAFKNNCALCSCGCLSDCHNGSDLSSGWGFIWGLPGTQSRRGRESDQEIVIQLSCCYPQILVFNPFCSQLFFDSTVPVMIVIQRSFRSAVTFECFRRHLQEYFRAKNG